MSIERLQELPLNVYIRRSQKRDIRHTFFVGAAVEKKMADEIWNQLKDGTLSNAANLNEEKQIVSISRWLCTL